MLFFLFSDLLKILSVHEKFLRRKNILSRGAKIKSRADKNSFRRREIMGYRFVSILTVLNAKKRGLMACFCISDRMVYDEVILIAQVQFFFQCFGVHRHAWNGR